MPTRLQLAGKKFGDLTVIEFAYMKDGISWWKCRCVCGNQTTVRGNHIVNGGIKSCGCRNQKNKKNLTAISKKNYHDGTSIVMIRSKKIPTHNTSGHKGVCWKKQYKKWEANIIFKGKQFFLGRFTNIEDAINARKQAEDKYYKPELETIAKQKRKKDD